MLRAGAGVLAAAAIVLAGGAAAQAHVQVIADETAAGTEITKITFRVPTESDTANTTKVQVSLPADTPFAEVLAEPLPGWSATVTEGKLPKPVDLEGTTLTKAPLTVTWTADKGQGIKPGEFQEFAVSAGPIPDAEELSFPVTQSYSDGTSVTWDQPQAPGAEEPENPLPSFTVTAAEPEDSASTDPAPASSASPAAAASGTVALPKATDGASSSDPLARWLGAAGLLAGLAGLGAGIYGRRTSGSTA
jgi:uncharacterized protein YcnI